MFVFGSGQRVATAKASFILLWERYSFPASVYLFIMVVTILNKLILRVQQSLLNNRELLSSRNGEIGMTERGGKKKSMEGTCSYLLLR